MEKLKVIKLEDGNFLTIIAGIETVISYDGKSVFGDSERNNWKTLLKRGFQPVEISLERFSELPLLYESTIKGLQNEKVKIAKLIHLRPSIVEYIKMEAENKGTNFKNYVEQMLKDHVNEL